MKTPGLSRHTILLIAAFVALYLIWGSTYLAIRVALGGFPPFILGGLRFTIAGLLMFGWFSARGAEMPRFVHWKSALVIGALLLIGGNGGVVWAEQTIDSGMVSLLVSVVPMWIVLLDWVRPGGKPPSKTVVAGLLIGFIGVAILVGPTNGGKPLDWFGIVCVMVGSLSWAAGSLLSKHAELPKNALMSTAIEMLCGGVLLIGIAVVSGETKHFHFAQVTSQQWFAFSYLIVFGSIIGYSAYIWLLTVVNAAKVSTYAYVNPMVAVFLGWAIAGESLAPRTLVAAVTILAAVALITNSQSRSKEPAQLAELEDECLGPVVGPVVGPAVAPAEAVHESVAVNDVLQSQSPVALASGRTW